MGNRRPLVIHKTEWDRLKAQTTTSMHYHKQLEKQKNEYLKPLIEQSQNWIKSWPDTVQGHIYSTKVEKIKKQQYDKDMALIKSFIEKSKRDLSTDAIQKARQQIFEDSCYGKQLLSALRGSKILEERHAQIKFKEKTKQKELQHNKEIESKALTHYLDLDKNIEEKNRLKRLKNIEIAQINRSIYKMKKEKRSREKEHERQMRKEDELLGKKFQEAEALAKEKEIERRKKDIAEFKDEQKKAVMQKIKVEKLTQALDELWLKYKEKRQCQEKRIFNKLLHSYDTIESHKHYELIQKLKDDEKIEYEDFIKKGIELHEKELKLKDEEDNQKQEQKHENLKLLVQYNKTAAEQCKGVKCKDNNKDACDRQCILAKSRKNRKSSVYVPDAHKYLECLRKRDVEPASWTGASAAHEQFAQFAKRTLQDSRYKLMAQKVIDNYIKVNYLDPTTFP